MTTSDDTQTRDEQLPCDDDETELATKSDVHDDSSDDGADGENERPSGAAIGSNFREERLGDMEDWTIVKRLWRFMRPYRVTFLFCLLLLPVMSGLELLQPHLLQIAIDQYLVPAETMADLKGIGLVIGAFGGAIVMRAGIQFLQHYLMQRAGQNALVDLRRELFEHVQDRPLGFFHDTPIGRLMARMTTDVKSLQNALSSGIITMVGDLIMLTGIVVILLWKSWRLALVSFTVLPFLIAITAFFRHYLREAFRDIRTKIARLYAHLQESITGMEIIQLFVREHVSADEYRDINEEYRDANLRSIRYDAMLYAIVEAIGSITIGAIIWYGSGRVLEDVMTLGVLVAFIEYMKKFFVPIRDLAEKYNQLQSAIASGERIFQLLDNERKVPEPDEPAPLPERPFRIEFNDVWFAYNEGEWVLQDVDFEIAPGERIALVGHTGAGKSTIINLLMRFYDVDRGEILVNGTDIRDFDLHAYRNTFAVVLQDVFLFEGTLRENVTLRDDSIDEDTLRRAAEAVHVDDLVERYEGGWNHEIEERGANLSSGEKQLVSFARALVHQPEVLVLDEATASVDADTEALIQDAVETLLEHQTSLVIAHRLSTIESSDRILVLDEGEVIERGTHAELLEMGGHYETLHELQYATSGGESEARVAE